MGEFTLDWDRLGLLIVEDHEQARVILTELARSLGVGRVMDASSAEAALEMLNTTSVDIVCTDLHMPGLGGIGLLRAIRHQLSDSWNAAAGCIAITGDDRPTTVALAMRSGADFFMAKPISPQALATRLSVAARRAHDRREQQRHSDLGDRLTFGG